MKNKTVYGVLLFSIFLQKLLVMLEGNLAVGKSNFLLSGVSYTSNYIEHNTNLIVWIFPILLLLFLFNGEVEELYHGYGILQVVRGKHISKIVIKRELAIGVKSACILFLHMCIMQNGKIQIQQIQGYLMLFLTIFSILLFQFVLEHFLKSNVAYCIVLIGFVVSVAVSNISYAYNKMNWLRYVLFANHGFLERNGFKNIENSLDTIVCFWVLIAIIIAEILFSLYICRKRDFI